MFLTENQQGAGALRYQWISGQRLISSEHLQRDRSRGQGKSAQLQKKVIFNTMNRKYYSDAVSISIPYR